MSDSESVTPPSAGSEERHWTDRFGKPVIFVILTLIVLGIYVAFSVPVAVFPETNFPRVVLGVENGVMPIDQMLVSVTRPIEEAVNTVQGLDRVYSITSRGDAEINLFFQWNVDMDLTLQLVNAALARVQSSLPPTVQIRARPHDLRGVSDHGIQPHVGHGAANGHMGIRELRDEAASESRQGCFDRGRRTGRPDPRIPGKARPGQAGAGRRSRCPISSTPSAAAT
jgi:hypothetical protein